MMMAPPFSSATEMEFETIEAKGNIKPDANY